MASSLHIAKAFGLLVLAAGVLVGRIVLDSLRFILALFASADCDQSRENDIPGPMFDDLQMTGKLNHRTGRYDDGSDMAGMYDEQD